MSIHHRATLQRRARHQAAMARPELRQSTTPHVFPSGVVSAPIKPQVRDPEDQIAIDQFLLRRVQSEQRAQRGDG